jgi:LPS export ABC transporter protein LptC
MHRRLSLPLLAFALLLLWVLLTPRQTLMQRPAPEPEDSGRPPDSYAVELIAREFDENGTLISETVAAELRRFQLQNLVAMSDLERRNFVTDGDWLTRADRGALNENNNVLELRGNVTLRYLAEGAVLSTEALDINLTSNTARSLAPVNGEQGDNSFRAESMFVNMNSRRATFSDGVSSRFAPPG